MSGRTPDPETDPSSGSRGESDEVLEAQVVFKGPRKLRKFLNGGG